MLLLLSGVALCRPRLQGVQRQLSLWLRDQVRVFHNYGAANSSLVQFFKQQAEAARQVGVAGALNPPWMGVQEGHKVQCCPACCPGPPLHRLHDRGRQSRAPLPPRGAIPATHAQRSPPSPPCRAWWMAAGRPPCPGQRARDQAPGRGLRRGLSKLLPRVRAQRCPPALHCYAGQQSPPPSRLLQPAKACFLHIVLFLCCTG